MKLSILAFPTLSLFLTSTQADDLSVLGREDLSWLEYDFSVTVDENCEYTFEVKFKHNESFPVGGDDTCQAGEVASDNKLYLEARYYWERFPPYVKDATELDHLSLDWNACDPTGGFLTPHYDLHYYRVTPEWRVTELLCEVTPGTPACAPDGQTTESGMGFFEVERSNATGEVVNAPPNFDFAVADAVEYMGMHIFDLEAAPQDPSQWNDPTYVLLAHNSQIIGVEPMLPYHYVIGDTYHEKNVTLAYVEKSIDSLPHYYGAEYVPETRWTTVVLKGPSNTCKEDFDAAKAAYEASQVVDDDTGDSAVSWGSSFVWGSSVAFVVAALL